MMRTMQRDDVGQRPHGTALVLPCRARQPREAVLRRDRVLVEALGGEPARSLVVLHAVRDDGGEVDVATEVAREVACGGFGQRGRERLGSRRPTEVRGLFDDGW